MFGYDFDYTYAPDWQPEGAVTKPWFLTELTDKEGLENYTREYACAYRAEKLCFVRGQLSGVDHDLAIKEIVDHVLRDSATESEKFRAIVFFIQKMMVHLLGEQPMEENAARLFRGLWGDSFATQAEPYPEDLEKPWMRKAFDEAKLFGAYLGLWCNPLGVTLDGDWGIGGAVTDALELLMLHEGRCGHQAMVAVQLGQAAGIRARLTQVNHHRVAEFLIDGRWVLADPDALAPGFIGTDDEGNPASVQWCIDNSDRLRNWPTIPFEGIEGYHWFFKISD